VKKLKVLILSGSTGGGHVKAANSLQAYSEQFAEAEFHNIDVIRYMSLFFKKFYADAYINIVNNYPSIFKHLYNITDCDKESKFLISQLRYHFENIFTGIIRYKIRKLNPDYIIFTHFLPAEHFNKTIFNEKYAKRYAVVVTDFDVHWLWVQDHMDFFFVANDESACKLVNRGIKKEKVFVTGIPIEPQFSHTYDKFTIRQNLGINSDLKTILFMSGAAGVGRIDELIKLIITKIDKPFQLLALTGTNKHLFKNVKSLESLYPGKIKAVPFTNKVYEYMAASDFAITKTGGLTTSECLAMGLPIISINPIPGQEERNTHYLLENGACLSAFDEEGLLYRIETLLNNPEILINMQKNAKKIARPLAAYTILKTLIDSTRDSS